MLGLVLALVFGLGLGLVLWLGLGLGLGGGGEDRPLGRKIKNNIVYQLIYTVLAGLFPPKLLPNKTSFNEYLYFDWSSTPKKIEEQVLC